MTTPDSASAEPLWSDTRIDMVEPRFADKAHLMKLIRDDERKPLLERIAELERMYKDLLELNKRNCDDAARIMGTNDALLALMNLGINDFKAKDERIAQLEKQLADANGGHRP